MVTLRFGQHDVCVTMYDQEIYPAFYPVGVLCWGGVNGCKSEGCTCECHRKETSAALWKAAQER
jgi:hypothetical protein